MLHIHVLHCAHDDRDVREKLAMKASNSSHSICSKGEWPEWSTTPIFH